MNYSIKVNETKNHEGNVRAFASVVLGDCFKITNIAIVENKERGQIFISMPRYKSSEKDEEGMPVYKDICNPITGDFRNELYRNIITEYENTVLGKNRNAEPGKEERMDPPSFSVSVKPYENDKSSIKGLVRVYFDDCFVVNNISIFQGKEKVFVAMPSYKTKQKDENGKDIYQDICYPVTKEFREKLYGEIERAYEASIIKKNNGKNRTDKKKTDKRKDTERTSNYRSYR